MTVPIENLAAAYPRRVAVCKDMWLRPMTLGDAIVLSAFGVDFSKAVDDAHALVSGLLLSGTLSQEAIFDEAAVKKGLKKMFAKVGAENIDRLRQAVDEVFDKSFLTCIPFAAAQGAHVKISQDGLGWPLELAEATAAEYGWPFDTVLETPVVRIFALNAARHRRNGGKFGGPDYVERIEVARMKTKEARRG